MVDYNKQQPKKKLHELPDDHSVTEVNETEVVKEEPVVQPVAKKVKQDVRLNVRQEPDSKAPIIGILEPETEINVVDNVKGYFQIQESNGITGYVLQTLVE